MLFECRLLPVGGDDDGGGCCCCCRRRHRRRRRRVSVAVYMKCTDRKRYPVTSKPGA